MTTGFELGQIVGESLFEISIFLLGIVFAIKFMKIWKEKKRLERELENEQR